MLIERDFSSRRPDRPWQERTLGKRSGFSLSLFTFLLCQRLGKPRMTDTSDDRVARLELETPRSEPPCQPNCKSEALNPNEDQAGSVKPPESFLEFPTEAMRQIRTHADFDPKPCSRLFQLAPSRSKTLCTEPSSGKFPKNLQRPQQGRCLTPG